jgi:hypothetical protein
MLALSGHQTKGHRGIRTLRPAVMCAAQKMLRLCLRWVIRVAPTGSKASPNVRYAFNGDRICASQRTDAMCQQQTSSGYSMTSSAPASSEAGTVSPSVLAVLRLITNANLVGNSTGILAGRPPLRILSTSAAARLYISMGFGA